ncbi:alpha/beta fold hydrolase [Bradyrhizobium japonicum]
MAARAKTFLLCHGAWSGGWAWKKMHPLMAQAGHRLVGPTYTGLGERAHLASPAIDLETHIRDILNVIKFEDLNDIVLLGHSYGGMVATGVADRARERVTQLIYLDAFVPRDGQSLFDLNEGGREPMRKAAAAATATVSRRSAAAGYAAGRSRLAQCAPHQHADQMFRDEAQARTRRTGDAAQLHLLQARSAGRCVRAVREAHEERGGLALFELDASHAPNVTAPGR